MVRRRGRCGAPREGEEDSTFVVVNSVDIVGGIKRQQQGRKKKLGFVRERLRLNLIPCRTRYLEDLISLIEGWCINTQWTIRAQLHDH